MPKKPINQYLVIKINQTKKNFFTSITIEKFPSLSVNDSEESSNDNSLNDSLEVVYEGKDEPWTPSVSLFDSDDNDDDDCKNGKQVQSDQQTLY